MTSATRPLKRALRPGGVSTGLIKGEASDERLPGYVAGFSASGQDIWLPKATHFGPGLVLSAVGARCGKVFLADGEWSVVANTVVLTPEPGHDAKFLWYLVNLETFWERGGTAQPYVRVPETLARAAWLPSMAEQRAIADYLDAETARIDALITKKQQLIHLLEERLRSFLGAWSLDLSSRFGSISLRRACSGVEQGWSPVCDGVPAAADEWGVLKTSSISPKGFVPTENKKLPDGVEPERRWQVQDGDLLLSRGSGSLGRVAAACVAYVGRRLLTMSDLVYRVRLDTCLDAALVAALLGTPDARSQIESSIRTDAGQTLKVRGDDLLDIRIPNVFALDQEREIRSLRDTELGARATTRLLTRQIALLTERRQALITAAVTGEFTVPGAP